MISDDDSATWHSAPEAEGAAPSEPRTPPDKLPSRLAANLYLVIGIALLIANSALDLDTLARYAVGSALLVLLALLALLFMRAERLEIRATARFHRAETRATLLALASVPSLWITGVALNLISALIFGYTTPVPPTIFPRTALEAVALALTTMVAAPIFEEIMFRGYVQRAYERRGIWAGIVVGGLIFSLYHLRFQSVFALIPVALALGFVAWRTGSIYPAMLMHAAYNTIATAVLISTSFLSAQVTGMLAATVACIGLLVAPFSFAALWMLWKRPPAERAPLPQPPSQARSSVLRWVWVLPLLALLVVYTYAAATEVLVQRHPETLLDDTLYMTPPDTWEQEVAWTYTIESFLGDELGTATCSRLPREAHYALECEAAYEGFDIADALPDLGDRLEGFDWRDLPLDFLGLDVVLGAPPQSWTLTANWEQQALELTTFDLRIDLAPDPSEAEAASEQPLMVQYTRGEAENGLVIRHPGEEARTLPLEGEPVVMLHEWAWRFSALPFDLPYGGPVTVVEIDAGGDTAIYRGFLRVAGGEPAWTPAGNFIAWRLTLSWEDGAGRQHARSAWYQDAAPYMLVRYDDGSVSYLLESIETGP